MFGFVVFSKIIFEIQNRIIENHLLICRAPKGMLTTNDFNTTLFFIIMSSADIVLKWAFEKVFTGSTKITKLIHSCLKATILLLAGLEVSIAGSMHAVVKHRLLRDKIMEQSEAFVKTYTSDKRIPLPTYVTCNLLRSADIAQKKDWKIAIDSETTWRSYQNEVKDLEIKFYLCGKL